MRQCRHPKPVRVGDTTRPVVPASWRMGDPVEEVMLSHTAFWSCPACQALLVQVTVRFPDGQEAGTPLTVLGGAQ